MDPVKSYHVVIDPNVLAVTFTDQPHFFLREGAVITAQKTHYVFPGAMELIRHLFQQEDIRVSFFGTTKEDSAFIRALLESVSQDVIIHTGKSSRPPAWFEGDCRMKKDLTIFKNVCPLKNTLFIVNDLSVVAAGQKGHALLAPEFRLRKREEYDETGHKKLPCYFVKSEKKRGPDCRAGNCILVKRVEKRPRVEFLNKYGEHKITNLSPFDAHLCKKLQKLKKESEIQDEALSNGLYSFVASRGGSITKLCREMNTIYYVTGVLFEALNKARMTHSSLSACLAECQRKNPQDLGKYPFSARFTLDHFYHFGLGRLRVVNPKLSFISPERC